ncbi:MAG: YqjF family protein [Luteolibacter sp.]
MTPPTQQQRLAQRSRPTGLPVMKQRWAGLGFFHWVVDPEIIAARLPSGIHLDTFEGKAYLGVVPFFMQRIRPVCLPPLPWLSWFHELNLRTYVFDDAGNPGVWFFSLDCNQPLAVEIARIAFNLPYQHARMSSKVTPEEIHYHSLRKDHPLPASEFTYPRPTSPALAGEGTLEWFLVERYRLFSANRRGQLFSGMVHHQPYLIQPMPAATCSTTPFALNDFPEPTTPPASQLSASTVDVTIFPLRKL